MQVVGVKPPPDAGQGNAKLGCMSAFGVFLLFSILTASTQSGVLAAIGFVAAIAVGILVFVKSKKAFTPRYLEWVDRIVDAIENPPETEQSYTVSNVFLGDQFNRYGNGNIGKIGQRSGDVRNQVSVAEQLGASAELTAFIAHLHEVGLLSPDGDPVDTPAIEAEIVKEKSTLRKVVNVLGRGAKEALAKTVNHVVVPLLLKLVEKQLQ